MRINWLASVRHAIDGFLKFPCVPIDDDGCEQTSRLIAALRPSTTGIMSIAIHNYRWRSAWLKAKRSMMTGETSCPGPGHHRTHDYIRK